LQRAASSDIAARYTEGIVSYCESLCMFPYRGNMRDDVRPGLRITHYKKRAVIAFDVDAEQVSIIGVSMAARTTKRFCKTTSTCDLSMNKR
jgi:plasmid stabilization system protein ParE